MNCSDIEILVCEYFGVRSNLIIPNVYVAYGTSEDHECDLLIINKSNYASEVEIKVSVSDFRNDFNKKHGHISEILKFLYYAMPEKVYEVVKSEIPYNAGCFVAYESENGNYLRLVKHPKSKKARKLFLEELVKFSRLGVIKLWKSKGCKIQ